MMFLPSTVVSAQQQHFDVLIYKATPAGIAASLSAAHMGRSVLILEPSQHIGGMMTEGGIGMRDIPIEYIPKDPRNSLVLWGLLNGQHYGINSSEPIWQPDNWVGEKSLWKLIDRHKNLLQVRLGTDIWEGAEGLVLRDNRIKGLRLETNETILCSTVIDASYEADLVLAANLSHTVGREAKSTYKESLAGITDHSDAQFKIPIDPFDSEGNLIEYVQPSLDPHLHQGEEDHNVMGYSYRACLTKGRKNRVPITPPDNFNPKDFELARRYVLAELAHGNGTLSKPWGNLDYRSYNKYLDNRPKKFDACCGDGAVGIDAIGLAKDYPTASRERRKEIAYEHRYYVQGLLWFWQNDPSIPKQIRRKFREFGFCRDEWPDNGHFPRQLYVREAARLIGDRVYTQLNHTRECRSDSIAYGSWGIDIHDVQRLAYKDRDSGSWKVMNEGMNFFHQGGAFVFDIPYWILLPKREEMENLLVVNAPSVSHVAFAAVRVEPTLWHLGMAAGTAGALALANTSQPILHRIDVRRLQKALQQQGVWVHGPRDCTQNQISAQ